MGFVAEMGSASELNVLTSYLKRLRINLVHQKQRFSLETFLVTLKCTYIPKFPNNQIADLCFSGFFFNKVYHVFQILPSSILNGNFAANTNRLC